MRDRRHISNVTDVEASGVQCTYRGVTTGARALDANFEVANAHITRGSTRGFRRSLGRERCALSRTLKALSTSGRPGKSVTVTVRDRDDGVVEGCVDMRNSVDDVLAYLALLCAWFGHNLKFFCLKFSVK